MKIGKTVSAKNRKEWRSWRANNHKSAAEIWLIYYKKVSGKPRVPYNDAKPAWPPSSTPAKAHRSSSSACAIISR